MSVARPIVAPTLCHRARKLYDARVREIFEAMIRRLQSLLDASAAAPLHGPVAAAALLAPSVALACSGPGAAAQIAKAEEIGWLLFVSSLVIGGFAGWHALGSSVSRGLLGSMALLVIVHPGWWMSARWGDCGLTRIEASAVASALIVILAAVLSWRARGRS